MVGAVLTALTWRADVYSALRWTGSRLSTSSAASVWSSPIRWNHLAHYEKRKARCRSACATLRHVLLALMVVIAAVSVWTPLDWQYVADRWFTLPNFFWFLPVPLLVGIFSVLIWRLTRNPASHAPFPADAGADLPRV